MSALLKGDDGTLPPWHDKPFRLTQFQIDHPETVVNHYMEIYGLADIRHTFTEMIRDAYCSKLTGDYDYLGFQEQTERVLEAMTVLHEQGKFNKAPVRSFEPVADADKHWRFMEEICREQHHRVNNITFIIDALEGTNEDSLDYVPFVRSSLNRISLLSWEQRNTAKNFEILFRQLHGKKELLYEPAEIQLCPLLNSCILPFDGYRKAFKKWVDLKIDPSLAGKAITTDATRLRQVLHNLLYVALKFLPPDNSIIMYCRQGQGMVSIMITFPMPLPDNRWMRFIFQPYEAFSVSAIAGLNLHICKLLMEPMGQINAENDQISITFSLNLIE